MESTLQDFRFAVRQLRRTPGFVLAVVLTLALGIGVNTAIFSLLDQALLRALPVQDPERLVILSNNGGMWNGSSSSFGGDVGRYFSYPMYRDLQSKNTAFQDLAATAKAQGDVSIVQGGHAELSRAELVSGNYFQLLGVQPAAGRLFTSDDDSALGANPVVVLSARAWQQRFGGHRDAVGQVLSINGHPFQIIGVAAPAFQSAVWGQTPDVFLPMSMLDVAMPGTAKRHTDHMSRWLNIFGRLKPGETTRSAEASLAPLWHSLRAEELKALGTSSPRFVASFLTDSRLSVVPGAQGLSYSRGKLEAPLLAVMGMAVLVLLIAATNVAGLLLVRSAARVREFSLRLALGASAARLSRQLLLEGLLLGSLGGLAGLLLAPLALHALIHRLQDTSSGAIFSSALNLRLLLFSFSIAFLLSVLFSIAPALQLLRPNLVGALKQQSGTASGHSLSFRRVIVGLQIGLSVILLMGAGLFVRTMRNLHKTSAGFTIENLISFSVDPRLAGYKEAQVNPLHKQLMETLANTPGITAVAGTTDPELEGSNTNSNVTVQGYSAAPDEDTSVETPLITPGYLRMLQLPLLAGREFASTDDAAHPHVVLVNKAFVKRFLGGDVRHALGRKVARGAGSGLDFAEIVGVVQDAHHSTLRDEPAPTMFSPDFQNDAPNPLTYYVRSLRSVADTEEVVRNTIQSIAPAIAPGGMQSLQVTIESTLRNESLIELLAIAFGLLATLLSGVGLYGVLAYDTAQRTREIGVRMAVGATRFGISQLVLRDVLRLAGVGLVLAIPCGVLLARLVRAQLFGVSPTDLPTLCLVTALIATVALVAAAIPAQRASSIDPMRALRAE